MITEDHVAFFHKHGYLHLPGVYDAQEIALLSEAADAAQQDALTTGGDPHVFKDGIYWRTEEVWKREPIWKAATVHPVLLDAVARCLGRPFIPFDDAVIVKLAGNGAPVPFHQDPPFGFTAGDPGPQDVPMFTCDIYLDRATVDNGCVWMIPGRQNEGRIDLSNATFDEAVPVEVEPGDLLFHHLATPHGSKPNTSDDRRRTFYIAMTAEEPWRKFFNTETWRELGTIWGDPSRELIASMFETRRSLGLSDPESTGIHLEGDALAGLAGA